MPDLSYYNELEAYPAQWLRNLADAGYIAPGRVDQRDIREVQPHDIKATQAHFFAGIGVWSYALRLAGWPDEREVWTGSCPCQPFSAAGKRGGTDDPRHLWPEWFRLIRECKPGVIFGEQVASKDGLAWLDLVCDDLEGAGYTVAALDLCAAGVGAPHIRQRIYFVAYAESGKRGLPVQQGRPRQAGIELERSGQTGILADATELRREWDGAKDNAARHEQRGSRQLERESTWSDLEWLPCRDGKHRPTQPGLFPLANGAASRVGRLRAYGNAIVAPLAAEFIKTYMEVINA